MARKKKHEEHENHERWLVSYADFITLLFAFFVVMYAISSVNTGKHRVLSDSLVAAFRDVPKSMEPIQVGNPSKSPVPENQNILKKPTVLLPPSPPFPDVAVEAKEAPPKTKPIQLFGETPMQQVLRDKQFSAPQGEADKNAIQQKPLPEVAAEIAQALADLVQQRLISLHSDKRWLEIEINESVLFASGRARPEPHALPIMQRIAEALSPFSNAVHVEGFTDNIPINTFMFPSNWELSAARAASVAHLLANDGIEESRLVALGYGEQRPVADNATAEGRRQNRRIVLVILADESMRQQLETEHAGISRDRAEPVAVSDSVQAHVDAVPVPVLSSDVVTQVPVPLAVDVSTPAVTPVESQATVVPEVAPQQPPAKTPPVVVVPAESPVSTANMTKVEGASRKQVQVNAGPEAPRANTRAMVPTGLPMMAAVPPPIRLFTPLTLPPVMGAPASPKLPPSVVVAPGPARSPARTAPVTPVPPPPASTAPVLVAPASVRSPVIRTAPAIVVTEPVPSPASAAPTVPALTTRRNVPASPAAQASSDPVQAVPDTLEPVARPVIAAPVPPPIRLFTPFSLPPITGSTSSPGRAPSQETRQ